MYWTFFFLVQAAIKTIIENQDYQIFATFIVVHKP